MQNDSDEEVSLKCKASTRRSVQEVSGLHGYDAAATAMDILDSNSTLYDKTMNIAEDAMHVVRYIMCR